MAGNKLVVGTNGEVATGTAAKTVLILRAGNGTSSVRLKVEEISVAFKGSTQGNPPILVEVVRFNSMGTGTSVTPNRINLMSVTGANNDTFYSTAQKNSTVEPTGLAQDLIAMQEEVHPQTGFTWQARFGSEIHIPAGGYLGIRVTATVDVNCTARMVYEE